VVSNPEKSTATALLTTTYDWLKELEAGKEVCSVFLDITGKAFDSIPHRELFQKLASCTSTLLSSNGLQAISQ